MTYTELEASPPSLSGRISSQLRQPLYRNGYALVASSAVNALLGVIYWVVAARQYTPAQVGLDSAAISAMMFLAGVAQLNLIGAMIRFIPQSGRRTRRLVVSAYATSAALAVVVSAVFLVGVGAWSPRLGFLAANAPIVLGFIVATMAWSVFVLQDGVLTGLRRAVWVPVENSVFGSAKIVLVIVFASTIPNHGVFASWTVALAASIVPTTLLIFGRLVPAHERAADPRSEVTVTDVARYVAWDYVGALLWLAATMLVPVIITQELGADRNAAFALAWVVAYTLYLVSAALGSSLVAEASSDPARLVLYSRKIFTRSLQVVTVSALVLVAAAPLVLRIFGPSYAHSATPVLRLLLISAVPNAVNTVAVSVARTERRMTLVLAILVPLCGSVLISASLLLPVFGVAGVGIAWLGSQLVVAGAVSMPMLLRLWAGELTGEGDRVVDGIARLANRLRLVEMAGWVRNYPDRRRRRVTLGHAVPAIVAGMPELGRGDVWWRLVPTVSDLAVAVVGPNDGRPTVVVKLAAGDGAARSLVHQGAVLESLRSDVRLDGWQKFLPRVVSTGEVAGRPYVVEELAGLSDARVLIADPTIRRRMRMVASETISELHRRTASTVVVDDDLLDTWVDQPLALLRAVPREGIAGTRAGEATAILGQQLRSALAGRVVAVSWTHGDFTPSNMFMAPDGSAVTGIVDWEMASASDLAALDVVHLLLTSRALATRRELGQVVIDVIRSGSLPDTDGVVLAKAQEALPGEPIAPRDLVLLCWVRHIANNLAKASRYPTNRMWVRQNIDRVLSAVTG